MEMDWLDAPAGQLKRHFRVVGRFYQFVGLDKTYPCREMLEIRRHEANENADAVFVMMNPGRSKPLEGDGTLPLNEAVSVPTQPDTTQYQLMRLMGELGWSRVRVLNLSDLRTPDSSVLFTTMKEFEAAEGHDGHSIFSTGRSEALAPLLARRAGAPVVAAWGMDVALQGLARSALQGLGCLPVGLRHATKEWAYRHPLPKRFDAQVEWRYEAAALLGAHR
jgi:hypothetical protein